MPLDKIKPALKRLFGSRNDEESESNVSRRQMLIGLGAAGAVAFVAPTLLATSEAEAAGFSIHIGPRRRRRRRWRRRYYGRGPYVRGYRRRRRRVRRRRRRRIRRYW